MTKREFLKQLRSRLSRLSEAECDQVLLYWSEAIDDRLEAGMTEEQIFNELESPDAIALRILSELHQASEQTGEVHPAPVRHDDEDEEDEDEDEDEPDDEEDEEEDEDEDGACDWLHLSYHIPEIHIPEIKIPEIKIPDIPEIKIPEMRSPDMPEGSRDWYFGLGSFGLGSFSNSEEAKPRHRKLQAGPESVREIHIADHNNGIELQTSKDGKISFHWTENKYNQYEVSGENGILSLVHRKPGGLERLFNVSRREKVVVCVPVDFAGRILLETSNASIKVDDVHLSGSLELFTSNGGIKLDETGAQTITAKTSNSTIRLEEVKADRMQLETSNSKLSLERVEAENVAAHTKNGKLELDHVKAHTLVGVTCNASVEADYVDAQELDLRTSNGSISGELMGDAAEYSVESGTSNGKNQNPSRVGGERKLRAFTSNGGIRISFIGG